jgi:hypothetical protein
MVLRAGLKKMRLYVELKIYDKNRRKITGPQCVKHKNKKKLFTRLIFHRYLCDSENILVL